MTGTVRVRQGSDHIQHSGNLGAWPAMFASLSMRALWAPGPLRMRALWLPGRYFAPLYFCITRQEQEGLGGLGQHGGVRRLQRPLERRALHRTARTSVSSGLAVG